MKYALVTGAFGGLGVCSVKQLCKNGFTVFACDKDVSNLAIFDGLSVLPIILDVTQDDSIKTAVEQIKGYTDVVDVIVNGAGIMQLQNMIEGDEKIFRQVFEVNFWGAYKINRAFFDFLKPKISKIINITSEVARYSAHPFDGLYGISKTALDCYNDCLRRELQFLNIPVTKVQAGSFKTTLLTKANESLTAMTEQSRYYGKELTKLAKIVYAETNKANNPERFGKLIAKIAVSKRPKLCYRLKNSFKLRLMNVLPNKLQDKIYKIVVG